MEFTNELSRKTEVCLALFQDSLRPEKLADDDWFEDRAVDFLWWSHGLKAQKSGRSSLDFRLKDRPDIQKVVAGLLDTLIISLKKYLHADQESIRSQRDGSPSESGKSSSGSSWSEFSEEANASKSIDSAADDTKITDSDPKFYIETSLKMLTRISIAIRRSGTKLRYLKADEHLSTHSDDDEYMQLRGHLLFLILVGPYERSLFAELQRRVINKQTSKAVEIVVRSWVVDPSRATTIQNRLIEANIIRRNRITYARRFISKRATKNQIQETDVPVLVPSQLPKAFGTAKEPSTFGANAPEPSPLLLPAQLESGDSKPAETITANTLTATELGSQFALPTITPLERKKGALTIVTKMTQTGTKQDYPACPVIKGSFQCPYCVQTLTVDYTTKSRWRGHVAQDLNPYSCIYQACPESHTLFTTKEEWVKHTTTRHNSERWVCDDCILRSDQDDEFIFDSHELWEDHLRSYHNCSDNRLILLRNLSKRALTQISGCPLCKRPSKASRPDEDDHIAEHLHAWALKALPWDLNPDDGPSSDSPDMGSENDLARISQMSESTEDESTEDESVRGEEKLIDAIHREVEYLRDNPCKFSSSLYKMTQNLVYSIEEWLARSRLDAHNEIMLQNLISMNQTRASLLQVESKEDQVSIQQQQEIADSLCTYVELSMQYLNEVLSLGEAEGEGEPYSSHSSMVKGDSKPPTYHGNHPPRLGPDSDSRFGRQNRVTRKVPGDKALVGLHRCLSPVAEDDPSDPPPRPKGKTILIGIDLGALFSSVSWADSSASHTIHNRIDWYDADGNLEPDGQVPTQYNRIDGWKRLALQPTGLLHSTNTPQDRGLSVLKDLCSSVVEVHTRAARFLTTHLGTIWDHVLDRILAKIEPPAIGIVVSLSVLVDLSSEAIARLRIAATNAIGFRNATATVQINLVGQMEAAVMYAVKAQHRHKALARGPSFSIEDGEIVVVCDCGATGARAVSYEVITQTPPFLRLRTLTRWDSKDYGNRSADMAFVRYLINSLSSSSRASESTRSALESFVQREWEYGLKRSFTGNETVALPLPRRAKSGLGRLRPAIPKLVIEPDTMRTFFEETLSSTKEVINLQQEALKTSGKTPNSVILLGGLAKSPYISQCLQNRFHLPFQLARSTTATSQGVVELNLHKVFHQTDPVIPWVE